MRMFRKLVLITVLLLLSVVIFVGCNVGAEEIMKEPSESSNYFNEKIVPFMQSFGGALTAVLALMTPYILQFRAMRSSVKNLQASGESSAEDVATYQKELIESNKRVAELESMIKEMSADLKVIKQAGRHASMNCPAMIATRTTEKLKEVYNADGESKASIGDR